MKTTARITALLLLLPLMMVLAHHAHAAIRTVTGTVTKISDGDTIQLGYVSLPNAILHNMKEKRHLGVHTELLTDSMVEFIKNGIIDNTRKNVNRGKTVASFCMGTRPTYEFINDNPIIDFRPIDYTNNPMVIAGIDNMVAVNSALQVDLTGQATAESIGSQFYSGIGGSADFMRGAVLARGGKSILVVQQCQTWRKQVPCRRGG